MQEMQTTETWLKSIFNVNKEIDFERERIKSSLERIDKLEKQKEEIFDIISAVKNPTYKSILHKRYILGKKWEEISNELHYEEQHIHRLKKKAIEEVHSIRKGQ